jgi:Subtilase family
VRRRFARCPYVVAAWLLTTAMPSVLSAQVPAPRAQVQIRALQAEKAARTPAERKLASRLLYALRMRRGQPIAEGIRSLRTGVRWDTAGQTLVDVRAQVTPALLAEIERLGGSTQSAVPALGALRARLGADAIDTLAARSDVAAIRPADPVRIDKLNTTQGDVAHWADVARANYGIDGAGIRVGLLSDGVDSLSTVQATGDLPAVTLLPGQAGSGDEGTAMLEIVYDLAPGAELLFATALGGKANEAANILALAAAGADVIVDDVSYASEAVLQDDQVAAAVDSVGAAGVLYFSAAGNGGSLAKGTSGVWEGDFVSSGTSFRHKPAHAFAPGVTRDRIVADSPYWFTLHWSDPLSGSANDYDLYLLTPDSTQVIAVSNDVQNGNDDPFELIDSQNADDTGLDLLVVLSSGSPRFLHLDANRGKLELATAGQIGGHAAARNALSIAAVRAGFAGGSGGEFDGSEPVEYFSSDGPRRVFYEADGSAITPGDLLASGGELRQEPDLAAADCVSTATPGFAFFCGTSAAAPHAAAIAALLLELGGSEVNAADVRDALTGTAFDIEAVGVDSNAGYGLIDAAAAADAIAVPEPPGPLAWLACVGVLAQLSRRGRARREHRGPRRRPAAVVDWR